MLQYVGRAQWKQIRYDKGPVINYGDGGGGGGGGGYEMGKIADLKQHSNPRVF